MAVIASTFRSFSLPEKCLLQLQSPGTTESTDDSGLAGGDAETFSWRFKADNDINTPPVLHDQVLETLERSACNCERFQKSDKNRQKFCIAFHLASIY